MKPNKYIGIYAPEDMQRPDAEEVYVLVTDDLTIPWPEGLTLVQALKVWGGKSLSEKEE